MALMKIEEILGCWVIEGFESVYFYDGLGVEMDKWEYLQ